MIGKWKIHIKNPENLNAARKRAYQLLLQWYHEDKLSVKANDTAKKNVNPNKTS
ncbi:hypothetical protein JIR001_14470 [Polycladomyces abyssicola]|uniref:Uncharacterized protein n=1 Tax=Polycladomyces abyssicola TaxID=1125966 RepID=A0A8D5UEL5_9BACL|nr:hypothetical protein JIR001_14470 [Polycladomyces abyssicola]